MMTSSTSAARTPEEFERIDRIAQVGALALSMTLPR